MMKFDILLLALVAVTMLSPHLGVSANDDVKTTFLKRFISYINNMRHQMRINRVREIYWDELLAKDAQAKADSCSKELYSSGDDGSFYIKLEKTNLEEVNTVTKEAHYTSLTRQVFNRRDGKCTRGSDEEDCKIALQLFYPSAYLIGCGINQECSPHGLIYCIMNRRNAGDQVEMRRTAECPECTESFACNPSNHVCELKDPSVKYPLPEDKTELSKGVDSRRMSQTGEATTTSSGMLFRPSSLLGAISLGILSLFQFGLL